jgi:hypothetical protein
MNTPNSSQGGTPAKVIRTTSDMTQHKLDRLDSYYDEEDKSKGSDAKVIKFPCYNYPSSEIEAYLKTVFPNWTKYQFDYVRFIVAFADFYSNDGQEHDAWKFAIPAAEAHKLTRVSLSRPQALKASSNRETGTHP